MPLQMDEKQRHRCRRDAGQARRCAQCRRAAARQDLTCLEGEGTNRRVVEIGRQRHLFGTGCPGNVVGLPFDVAGVARRGLELLDHLIGKRTPEVRAELVAGRRSGASAARPSGDRIEVGVRPAEEVEQTVVPAQRRPARVIAVEWADARRREPHGFT